MNGIENYLIYRKRTLSKALPAAFIVHLIGTMTAFGIAYVFISSFPPESSFRVSQTSLSGNLSADILALSKAQPGTVFALVLLFASCFTVFSRQIMFALCLWRGASLGCAASLYLSGLIIGASGSTAALLFISFISTVLFVLLVSYASVYADCIIRSCSAGERKYTRSLIREFLICFLTLSGGVLSVGIISVIIL